MFKQAMLLAATLAFAPAAANAQNFHDDFNSEGTPGSHLNYGGFTNFAVTGQVDLVASPDYGISCDGKCVDLDGTSGPGSILSNMIAFTAGNMVTISFDLGGSQRSADSDNFSFATLFASPTDLVGLTTLAGFPGSPALVGDFASVTSISYGAMVPGNAGFTTYRLAFTPSESGSLQLSFGTTSADNIGPLLDNVSLVSVPDGVPEPATWAMMLLGFCGAGLALRRKRSQALAAG